ncbi:MAG TPA: conjugal transfer protein TraF [Candidatus Norongarragalinales archaeon]|nr:conjugal transfer protein TraF [Candidatus Norongarragalinales archaeon]
MKPEWMYGTLAVLLLFMLGYAFFAQGELGELKQRLSALEKKPETTAILVNALDGRLNAVEQKLKSISTSAKLFAFYDSRCTVCSNEAFLQAIQLTRSNLEKDGILVSVVDVKTSPDTARSFGVRTVPTFYATTADLSLNQKLVDFLNQLAPLQYGFQESSLGVIAQPPTAQVIFDAQTCALNGSVIVEEFHSPTCAFCRRVFYANGSAYNPANLSGFSEVSMEALDTVKAQMGAKINATSHCIAVHTLDENRQVLGLDTSDEGLCIEEVGSDAYKTSDALSDRYGLIGAPAFVVDCRYVSKVHNADALKTTLCGFRPDLCAG